MDYEVIFRKQCLNEIDIEIGNLELSFDNIENKKLSEQLNRIINQMKQSTNEIKFLLN